MIPARDPQTTELPDRQRSDHQTVQVFKALSHPFRLELLRILAGDDSCVCQLVDRTGRPQPYVSQQMSVLRRAGLVTSWRDGQQIHYKVNQERLQRALYQTAEASGASGLAGDPASPQAIAACCPSNRTRSAAAGADAVSADSRLNHWHGIAHTQSAWFPVVITDRCVGCGLCVVSCPQQVYAFDYEHKRPVVARPERCVTGCTTCAILCTQDAVEFPSRGLIRQVVRESLLRQAEDELLANAAQYDAALLGSASPDLGQSLCGKQPGV